MPWVSTSWLRRDVRDPEDGHYIYFDDTLGEKYALVTSGTPEKDKWRLRYTMRAAVKT